MLLAGLVFVATYVAVSVPRVEWRGRRIPRPVLAAAGGALMLATGSVSLRAAYVAIDVATLVLLLGMMLLVASLEVAGLFEALATAIVRRVRGQRSLLVAVMVAVAALSALVLNDAVVLLFTPVLVRATREMRVSATPYLAGEIVAANVGSVATPVGNPQNAYLAVSAGLAFPDFVLRLAPVAALALAVAVAAALVAFRRDLASPVARRPASAPVAHPRLLLAAVGIAGAGFVAFAASASLGVSLSQVALATGLAAFALVSAHGVVAGRGVRSSLLPPAVPRRVNWGILLFFVGLFVLLAGVRESGLLALFLNATSFARYDTTAGLGIAVAVLSNLVSNVPAVMLLAPIASSADAAYVLAAASTLAGNATLLGAAANVLVAESAREHGAELDLGRFVAFGFPVSVATVALALLWLG